jgi:hypothetical protein
MANQPGKRHPFSFWIPFWGNASAAGSSRTPAPAARATTQAPTPPTPPSDKRRRSSRIPLLSPSPSSSSSSSSSPPKQNQPRRANSRTPSSSLSSPTLTQSPSRRPSQSDQVKQKTKDESAQGADKSPETTSTQQGTTQEEKISSAIDTVPIEPDKARDLRTIDTNPEKEDNVPKDLEKIETKSVSFDPLTSDINVPTKPVIPDENRKETDEQKLPILDHEQKPQVQLDADINEQVLKIQLEENKQTQDEIDMMPTPTQDGNLKEAIKEIATKPIPDENMKEIIKETTLASDVNNLSSKQKSETSETVTTNYNNKYSKNKPDHRERERERENPEANNPRKKERVVGTSASSTGRSSFQKNIKDGISKLIQKVNTGNALNSAGSERGASIITLAGENKGASMYISHENKGNNSNFAGRAHKLNESSVATSSKGKEKDAEDTDEKDSKIAANVNSNVQSINNSILQESRCDTRDPGVHFRISTSSSKMKKKRSEGE